jgi:hypothetical protein
MNNYTVIVLEGELTPFVRGTPEETATKLQAGGLVQFESLNEGVAYINADKVLCLAAYEEEADEE